MTKTKWQRKLWKQACFYFFIHSDSFTDKYPTLLELAEPGFHIRTWLSDCSDVHALFLWHVSQNGENGKARQKAGSAVQQAKKEGVSAIQSNPRSAWRPANELRFKLKL